jgi:hypothetical protein
MFLAVGRVVGRADHVLLLNNYVVSMLVTTRLYKRLGEGTARNVTVVRALTEKWC